MQEDLVGIHCVIQFARYDLRYTLYFKIIFSLREYTISNNENVLP